MTRFTILWMLMGALSAMHFSAPTADAQSVEFASDQDEVQVRIDGRHVTSYLHSPSLAKPILFPVKTPGGLTLSRGYPLDPVEGETTDHPHQVGIFFTYDEVNDTGFWNTKTPPPQIKQIRITASQAGEHGGQLSTLSHWIAKDGETVLLEEDRTMTFQPLPDGYSIDFAIGLTAKTQVKFSDTKEGMFGIRTADWLRERGGTGSYVSSESGQSAQEIWGRRAKWVALQGSQNDRVAGMAILHHPSSVNYPTYWHARNYGLFSANPLGQGVFQRDTKVENPTPLNLTLQPGETADFRFLVLVYDGPRNQEQIEAEFQKFAK